MDNFDKFKEIMNNLIESRKQTKKELADIENLLKGKQERLIDSICLEDGNYTAIKEEIRVLEKKRDELFKQNNLLKSTKFHKRPFAEKIRHKAKMEVVEKLENKQREIADKVNDKLYKIYKEVIMLQNEIDNDNLDCEDIVSEINNIMRDWPKLQRIFIKRVRYDYKGFEEYKEDFEKSFDENYLKKIAREDEKFKRAINQRRKMMQDAEKLLPIKQQIKADKSKDQKIKDAQDELKKREALAKKSSHLEDKEEKKEA
ncbi:MAG: hypothetical protein ACFFDF_03885 [Candidatus Odinarchaeota archaeon]